MTRRSLMNTAAVVARVVLEMKGESDRGCVLVAHAFIDEQLKALLKAHLRRSSPSISLKHVLKDGPSALLGSFPAKVTMSAALGLINQHTFDTLRELNAIRNRFAHRRPIVLTDIHCKQIRDKMESFAIPIADQVREQLKENPLFTGFSATRIHFMCLMALLMYGLDGEIAAAQRRANRPQMPLYLRRFRSAAEQLISSSHEGDKNQQPPAS